MPIGIRSEVNGESAPHSILEVGKKRFVSPASPVWIMPTRMPLSGGFEL